MTSRARTFDKHQGTTQQLKAMAQSGLEALSNGRCGANDTQDTDVSPAATACWRSLRQLGNSDWKARAMVDTFIKARDHMIATLKLLDEAGAPGEIGAPTSILPYSGLET